MAKEILIVESDREAQEEFERIFEATGDHLFFTRNEEEALLRGRLFKPDLIIGGKRLCETIKTEKDLVHIPFILLMDRFEEISESERKALRPEGVLSKPLRKEEVLHLVDHLRDGVEKTMGENLSLGKGTNRGLGHKPENGESNPKGDFSLDESWDTDEEIIELVDVVEEPEPKMSIEDLVLQTKEEPFGEIPALDSWEIPPGEEVETSQGWGGSLEEYQKGTSSETSEARGGQEKTLEDELFEKIELEEILEKVERLQPSLEREFVGEEIPRTPAAVPTPKPSAPYSLLQEFETTMRAEEAITSLSLTEKPEEARIFLPGETSGSDEPGLPELKEDEFPEAFLEDLAKELDKLEEEEVEEAEGVMEPAEETAIEEEGEPEEFVEEELLPSQESLEETVLTEIGPSPETLPLLEEEKAPTEAWTLMETFEEGLRPRQERVQPSERTIEREAVLERRFDRAIEEVIVRGVQEMMQEFMGKVIPEIATQVITLTMDRIEKLVKEIVPELAEKAIREEIERLQKTDKD